MKEIFNKAANIASQVFEIMAEDGEKHWDYIKSRGADTRYFL